MNIKQYVQCPENSTSQQYVPQFSTLPGTFSPTGTFNDIYTTLISQNSTQRNQNRHQEHGYLYPDVSAWENLKLPEKIDFVEINNKDLSPGSYCSNFDSILVAENNFNSQYNNRYDAQWYNSGNLNYGQKSNDFSSCAQVNKYSNESNKATAYCTIQKNAMDMDVYKSCAYFDNAHSQSDLYKNKHDSPQRNYNTYNSYYNLKDLSAESSYCVQSTTVPCAALPLDPVDMLVSQNGNKQPYNLNYPNSDQHTEVSNDESDIVVEDFSSDCSEDQEKNLFYQKTRCLICNTVYTPMGLQFFFLTAENPLTMSSQIPVIKKILKILGKNITPMKCFLCNDCLGLLNTIDHLQMKLEGFYKDLLGKFKKSCLENKVEYKNLHKKRRFMFKRYKCKVCKKVINIKSCLENHVKRHKFRGYLCEMCGKIAPTIKKFTYHLKFHKRKNITMIPPFKCSNCDKIFRTKSNLKEHENFCLGILPYKCKNNYCDKKFPSITKLKNHTKLKHDKKFIAICSICNIGFVKVSDYKSHMISHSTDKKFACKKCGKCYKTMSNLNFHLKSHETVLPFICSLCQKGFMRKEYLEAHVNNHKGIKNYNCSVCEKKFVSQKNLDSHLKYHEGSVKTHTCNICGKVIASGFEEHLRVHSNLKEFDCDLCDMKFNTKNSLAKHKKRKHSKEHNHKT